MGNYNALGENQMKKQEKSYRHIERRYILTAKEIKTKLGIEGEITNVTLWKGRSPNDDAKGKSPDLDEWEINTVEQGFDGVTDKLGTKVQIQDASSTNTALSEVNHK